MHYLLTSQTNTTIITLLQLCALKYVYQRSPKMEIILAFCCYLLEIVVDWKKYGGGRSCTMTTYADSSIFFDIDISCVCYGLVPHRTLLLGYIHKVAIYI